MKVLWVFQLMMQMWFNLLKHVNSPTAFNLQFFSSGILLVRPLSMTHVKQTNKNQNIVCMHTYWLTERRLPAYPYTNQPNTHTRTHAQAQNDSLSLLDWAIELKQLKEPRMVWCQMNWLLSKVTVCFITKTWFVCQDRWLLCHGWGNFQ